jgi:hypothetical protein
MLFIAPKYANRIMTITSKDQGFLFGVNIESKNNADQNTAMAYIGLYSGCSSYKSEKKDNPIFVVMKSAATPIEVNRKGKILEL